MHKPLNSNYPQNIRNKVAREAANLIYIGIEKEFKQAKLKAAKTHRVHFLPTNLEVAIALDKIADEREGAERKRQLIRRRRQALKIMKILEAHSPVLIGSVWRGTAHRGSDIDITIYHNKPKEILKTIKQNDLEVIRTGWTSVIKQGNKKASFHIHIKTATDEVELVIRNPEEANYRRKCEIYGDLITGLQIQELERILKENPRQKFVPY